MAFEEGVEYNPETARDLRPKDFRIDAFGVAFLYSLQIPEFILKRLADSGVMDKLMEHMTEHAQTVVVDAMKGGYLHTDAGEAAMRRDVGKHLKNYIWERFSISQEKEGNERWQTAPTLQEVHA